MTKLTFYGKPVCVAVFGVEPQQR